MRKKIDWVNEKPVGFIERVFYNFLGSTIVIVFLIIFLLSQGIDWRIILIPIALMLMNIFRVITWARWDIVSLIINEEQVRIRYSDFAIVKTCNCSIKDIHVTIKNENAKGYKTLLTIETPENILKQYSNDFWNTDRMLRLLEILKKNPNEHN